MKQACFPSRFTVALVLGLIFVLGRAPLFAQLELSPPASITAAPGDTIIVPLTLTNPNAAPIDAFVFDFFFPNALLDYIAVDRAGTLTETWVLGDGSLIGPNQVRIAALDFTPATVSGVLIKAIFRVKDEASGCDTLKLRNFEDDLVPAVTTDGVFCVTPPPLVFVATLTGDQEVPPVSTPARGQVTATLSDSQLVVTGSFGGLSSDFNPSVAGGSHLHLAPAGQNGGVQIPLVPTLSADQRSGTFEAAQNTFTLTAEQNVALQERTLYANIHTTGYAGGEIRGQLLPEADAYYRVNLAGSNEVPPVNSSGFGALVGELKGDTLTLSGSFNNLASDFDPNVSGGSHIHLAFAGQNGPIQVTLVPNVAQDNRNGIFEAAMNKFTLTAEHVTALQERRLYVNIHTVDHPGGELRGQIVPLASSLFRTNLSGSQEVPPVETPARGALIFELDGNNLTASGGFSNLAGDFNGGSHLHLAPAGQTGSVLITLTPTPDAGLRSGVFEAANNTFTLVDSQVVALRARKLYANIHTTTSPGGEVRGQVLPENYSYYHAYLSGGNEVQPVGSSGRGGVIAEVSGTRLVVTGSFNNLASDFNGGSHLHLAPAGQNGSVTITLVPVVAADQRSGVFEAAGNTFVLTTPQADAFPTGELYANAHTTGSSSGELRGQVLFDPNAFPGPTTITDPPSGASINIAGSGSTPFAATWNAATDPNNNLVVYIWQLSRDRQFGNFLVNRNVGTATTFATDFATVDSLLGLAGIAVGDSVRLYHRVYSSDGSLQKASAIDSLVLRRGGLLSTIAAARAKANATTVTIEGIVTRTLGRFAYLQDATAGIPTFQISGPLRTAIDNGEVRKGDSLRVSGVLAEFNNLKELTASAAQPFVFQVLSRDNPLPVAQVVTLTEIAQDGEQYESELLRVNSLNLLPTTDANFRAATSYMVRDEGDTTTFRIGNSGDSRVIGRPVPPGLFDFEGVLGDFRGDYQLTPIDSTDILLRTNIAEQPAALPQQFALLANYPNPFNPATIIRYNLPKNVHVKLVIYDLLGKKVRTLVDAEKTAGFKHITWDGANDAGVRVGSGVYLYRIEAGGFTMARKMILMK